MKRKNEIGLIVLAAGASIRLGVPKQLLKFRGETLLRRIASESLASLCNSVIVVLGENSGKFKSELENLDVFIVENPNWQNGMGSSVKAGLEKLLEMNQTADAVVLTVCDQPFVTAFTINKLIETFQTSKAQIVASEYQTTLGVPALFSRKFFPQMQILESGGAKKIIYESPDETTSIYFPEGAIDIDTTDDYEKLLLRQ
jgi:molybdenum cofactor cytidylyltransferase